LPGKDVGYWLFFLSRIQGKELKLAADMDSSWKTSQCHVGSKAKSRYLGFFPFSFYRIAWEILHGNAFLTQHIKHKLVTCQRHHSKNTSTVREDRLAAAKAS